MKEGAFDYLVKPVEEASVLAAVRKALDFNQLKRQNLALKERLLSSTLERPEIFTPILTKSKAMLNLFRYLEAMAPSSQPILITGETGVGKELFALAVHQASGREGEFVPVNAAGLDDTVFSDTLFGHVKGAFTGAERNRGGLIEKAAQGTLFLDEIGDLHPSSQVKLLRLVEGGEYLPLGQDKVRISDARIVAATNQDLWELKRSKRFRTDLNFRLRSIHIHVPPLRERLEDLPLLIDHFLGQAAEELGKKRPTAPKELLSLLGAYRFPGNVRELKTMIFDAVGRHGAGVMSLKTFHDHIDLERDLAHQAPVNMSGEGPLRFPSDLPTIKQATDLLVAEALRRADGNQSLAARLLGVTPQAISKRLRRSRPGSP
jgi:DNA-binding NtrC family response regulator